MTSHVLALRPLLTKDNAYTVLGCLMIGALGSGAIDDFIVGEKVNKICTELQTEFTAKASNIEEIRNLPGFQGSRVSITVPLTREQTGAFFPWTQKSCFIDVNPS